MATNLAFYDNAGDPLSGSIPVDGTAGVPGTSITIELVNNKGGSGADTMTSAHLKGLFDDGSGAQESGTEWADRHYLQARIEAGGTNTNFSNSDWRELGADATLPLPDLANDEGVKIGLRLYCPPDSLTDVETVSLRVVDSPQQPMSQGVIESAAAGIFNGINDAAFDRILVGSDVVEDAPTSRNVEVQDMVWIAKGKPFTVVKQDVNIPVAAASKVRYDLLSLDADGSATVTKTAGAEVDGPLVDADKPATPTGDIPIAYVQTSDTGNMTDGDIENVWNASMGWYDLTYSGLTCTLSGGPVAVVDNSLLNNYGTQVIAATDDATSHIWLRRDGTLSKTTDGSNPADRALLMYVVVAAGGSISSVSDRRVFCGGDMEVVKFHFPGTITGSDEVYAHLHNSREAFILPLHGFAMSAGTNAAGASSGATILDLEQYDGSWTSLFGTGSVKPQIAYNASDPRDFWNALPTIWQLEPNARLRAQVDTLPSGSSTEAKDVTLTVLVVK